ncbi:putative zinc finger CCCH domain-containing protein 1-like [Capsicum annuum]|nr:putative zinc finger CCCH domain-containing protein 1-like [Capsicum annuum]
MASSQVEIASSSSSFGHVLRDRNRRDRCTHRDSNAFQKNLKDLVNTHIHSCISSSQPPSTAAANSVVDSNENHRHHRNGHQTHVDYADLWVHKPQWDNNENSPMENKNKSVGKWDRAREMVMNKQRETSSSYSPENTVVEVPNSGGVSTLVRRWRDFETVSKSVNSGNNSNPGSAKSNCENAAFADTCDDSSSVDGRFETPAMSVNGDSSGDWEQAAYKAAMNDVRHSDSNKESEKLRVADIIRKLAKSKGEESNENEHNCANAAPLATGECLPRIKTSSDHSEQQQLRNFFPVLHSPRILRGRQALSDLLLQMERDRLRELETLRERKAVSKFQQRGRIQALLKVRFLRRGTDGRNERSTNGALSETNRVSNSAIMHIRERFNTRRQNGVADSRSLSREAADNTQESRNSKPNQQKVQNCDKEETKGQISCQIELTDNNALKLGSELASHNQREGNQKREIILETAGMQPGIADSRSSNSPKSEIASTSTQENHSVPSDPMTLRINVIDNNSQVEKVSASIQLREENHHGEVNEKISPRQMTTNVKVTSSTNPQKEMTFHIRHPDSSCNPNHNEVECSHQAVSPSTSQLQNSDISHNQASWEKATCQANHDKSLELLETLRSPEDGEQSVHREEEDANNLQHAGTSNEWSSESNKPQSDWEEEVANQNIVDSDCGWVSDYSHTPSGWDELQSNYQQQSESNQDWVTDVSRPREQWEDLRQARYQEMLDPFLENHDIRQLLNRKSVSIFLNSGLREKIDRLMTSRSQQLPNAMSDQLEEKVGARMTKQVGKEEEVISYNETRGAEGEDYEEEADSGYEEDDFEDDNIPIRQQYLEPEELIDQNKASQTLQSWNNNQDRCVNDDSYHLPTNSSPQPRLSNIYSQHNQQCSSSSTRHTSIEMELIYELRGHMEQLHQEIFEIRRSINSCMNMQMNLQHSIKQEVAAAVTQSGPTLGSSSDKKGANRANCCICYEQQVDSLLYRCGHMCTCFRCAHELLWGTGKCPICLELVDECSLPAGFALTIILCIQ